MGVIDMADLNQLMMDLRAADKAGDTAKAQQLARVAKVLRDRQSAAAAPATAQPMVPPVTTTAAAPEATTPLSYGDALMNAAGRFGNTADAVVRRFADAATLGYADKLAAQMSPGDYDQNLAAERQRTEQAGTQLGYAKLPVDISGAISTALVTRPLSLLARFGAPAATIGGVAKNVGLGAVEGGILGAAEATGRDQNVGTGTAIGAGIGGGIPLIGSAISKAVSPIFSKLNPYEKELAARLEAAGMTLTPAQKSDSTFLKYLESQLESMPGGSLSPRATQQEQLNRIVLGEAGGTASFADPDTVYDIGRAAGRQFDTILSGKQISLGPQFKQDIKAVIDDYGKNLTTNVSPTFKKQSQALLKIGNQMSGDTAAKTREKLLRLAGETGDPQLSRAISQLSEALDNAVERSLPFDAAVQLRQARGEYKNYLRIKEAMKTTAEGAAGGDISPQRLQSAIINSPYGATPKLTEIAQAANQFMRQPPQSGTASRGYVTSLMGILGAGLGYGTGGGIGDAATGLALGIGTPMGANVLYNNPATRAYLTNTLSEPLQRAIPAMTRYGTPLGLLSGDRVEDRR